MTTNTQGEQHRETVHRPADTKRASISGNIGAFQLVKAGIQAVPAVKYALGIAGVMAALALGKAFFTTARMALLGCIAMLILMVLLLLFSAATKVGPTFLRLPALVLTWTILTLFVISASFSVASVFFDWPRSFPELTANILGKQKPPVSPSNDNKTQQTVISGTVFDTLGEPLKDVAVTIRGSRDTMTLTDSGGTFTISANSAVLVDFSKAGYESEAYRIAPGANAKITLRKGSK